MKTEMLTAFAILALALTACDGGADSSTSSLSADAGPSCVLNPSKVTQDVTVTGATSPQAGSDCAAVADQLRTDGKIGVKAGALMDAPIMLTSLRSYEVRGLACAYEIAGFAEVADVAGNCTLTVRFAGEVDIP